MSPLQVAEESWVGDRLEYRFRLGAGDLVLAAPAHGGGEIGWTTVDADPDGALARPGPGEGGRAEPAAVERQVHALLASPLRYPGMPADRLWEMEDAQVNLGLIEAEPWDLARLLVAEFALTYGNDWLVVPLDVPFGSWVRVESVLYVTTFGERFVVRPTAQVSPDGRWQMFAVTAPDGRPADGLLVPPGAVAVADGEPYEEVLFLRDEMANLAWAVERSVTGPSGFARDRSRERTPVQAPGAGPVATAELDYLLQTTVPDRWIPYLPRSSGYRAVELVQGAMPDAPGPAGPAAEPTGRRRHRRRRDPAGGCARPPPTVPDPARRRQLRPLDHPPGQRRPRGRLQSTGLRLGPVPQARLSQPA